MEPAELLTKLGGFAATSDLTGPCSRSALEHAESSGRIVRLKRGRYALPDADKARAAAERVGGVVSGLSAALQWDWKVKLPPERPVVTVPRHRRLSASRREGIDVRWADLEKREVIDGVTSKGRTFVDCCRFEPYDAGLSVGDSALREGDFTRQQLIGLAMTSPRTGRPAVLKVAKAADGRADNPFESVLRSICETVPGLTVVPQQWVGRVGRVDLLAEELCLVIEADSWEFHGSQEAFHKDIRRYTAFARLGYLVVRFTWYEVMFEQDYVRAVLTDLVRLGSPWGHRLAG
jgi:very-short-patch-repair endonuclease